MALLATIKKKIEENYISKSVSIVNNYYNIPEKYEDFLKESCRIRSGNKVIPFVPFDYQVALSDIIDRHRGIIVYKTRQLGITEAVAAKFLHKALLNPAYASACISLGQTESSNVSTRIQNMPAKITNLTFDVKSQTKLKFNKAGMIWFRPATDNAARSLEAISDLFFDEFAFLTNADELYSSAVPTQETVGDEARTIIASTMSELGVLSRFWQMFINDNPKDIDAEQMVNRVKEGKEEPFVYWVDNNGWAKVIIHWKAHPIYAKSSDYLEKTKQSKKLTESKLQREYNLGIPMSGGLLFSMSAKNRQSIGAWEYPNPERIYLGCIDPNFGGSDFWVTQIWDITDKPFKLVAEYRRQNTSTIISRDKSIALFDLYNPDLISIEGNGGGTVVAENIIELRPHFRVEVINTSNRSKIENTDRIAIALENLSVIFPPDWPGIEEMEKFSELERKAINGHDDCITCWAAGWVFIEELTGENWGW